MEAEELRAVAEMVAEKALLTTKEVLTLEEAAAYMGIKKSYMYKLTMRREIPHSKPCGKMCFFNRVELEQWLMTNPVATTAEIADRAERIMRGRR